MAQVRVFLISVVLWTGAPLRASQVPLGGVATLPDMPIWKKLSSFDTLHLSNVRHTTPARPGAAVHRSVAFTAFGRSFNLLLKTRQGLFHHLAGCSAVNRDGEVRDFPLPRSQFYEGVVAGEPDSYVHAHIDDRGILSAQISLKSEHYHVEPSGLHVNESHDYHMIVYRTSDVRANVDRPLQSGHCEQITLPVEGNPLEHPEVSHTKHRTLRQSPAVVADGESCSLHLIADHLFHRAVGRARISATVAYMTNIVSQVDRVYRGTTWGDGGRQFRNIGVHIANVTVLTEPDEVGYNFESSPDLEVVPHQLLAALSFTNWSSYCLVHLFTFRRFTGGTLGVAYTAPPTSTGLGGVCSQYLPLLGGSLSSTNVALSSLMDRETMDPTLAVQSLIIVAHELGHSFGSNHDPSGGGACDPPRGRGVGQGKYLMHMAAVDGSEHNNLMFSQCSRTSVGQVLEMRGGACFTGVSTQLCGNWLVEGDEDCDSGPGGDDCCDSTCVLRVNASCSDANQVCCENCSFAPSTFRCARRSTGGVSCLDEAFCTGNSGDCPPQGPLVGVQCIGRGQCVAGGEPNTTTCQPFCETVGMKPCICSAESECLLCCEGGAEGVCQVYLFNSSGCQLEEGTLCSRGYCSEGVCIQATADLGTRLFDLLTNLTPNELSRFILENLVGCVLILSTVVWLLGLTILKCILIPLWKKKLKSALGVQFVRCCGVETASVDVPTSPQPNAPMTPVRRQFSRMWSTSSGSSDHFYGKNRYTSVPLPAIAEEEGPLPPRPPLEVETAMMY